MSTLMEKVFQPYTTISYSKLGWAGSVIAIGSERREGASEWAFTRIFVHPRVSVQGVESL